MSHLLEIKDLHVTYRGDEASEKCTGESIPLTERSTGHFVSCVL